MATATVATAARLTRKLFTIMAAKQELAKEWAAPTEAEADSAAAKKTGEEEAAIIKRINKLKLLLRKKIKAIRDQSLILTKLQHKKFHLALKK